MTSSKNENLCKEGFGIGPENWAGGNLILNYNNNPVATLQSGFNDFQYCLKLDQAEFENAFFRLQSTSTDEVCITGLFVNDKQLLVGKNADKESFWFRKNQTSCLDDFMSTEQLLIKNGTVAMSSCKGGQT